MLVSLPANAPSYTSKGIGVVVVEVVVVVVVVEVKATLQDWSAVSNAHFILWVAHKVTGKVNHGMGTG